MGLKRIVGFSGGADSQATALWVRQRFPAEDVILLNADAGGNESPITTGWIQWYSDTIFPVTMLSPQIQDLDGREPDKVAAMGLQPTDPLTFELLAELKGLFPMSTIRFCTDHLKLQPQKRWTRENLDGLLKDGFERYIGVRRDESASRADVDEFEYDDEFGCWLHRPLATWTKQQVFDFLKEHGEEVNPLYKMGFERVGCAPCINSRKEDILLWATRFPEMIDKIRAWEKRVGKHFYPKKLPGDKYGFIDEVVEWSRTTHGGKQYALPLLQADIESGVCMSKYGLCE